MLRDMRAGKFGVIIVLKLDRLGRSLSHLINLLAEFKNKKITLISICDGLDTSVDTPMARAFQHLLSVFAQLEREIIVERVRAGIERARHQNVRLGRPPGSTDKKQRSKSGYLMRYANKSREARKLGPRRKGGNESE